MVNEHQPANDNAQGRSLRRVSDSGMVCARRMEAKEIVVVRPRGSDDRRLVDVRRPLFLPDAVLVRAQEGDAELALTRDRPTLRGAPTAYVCVRGACQLPVTDPGELRKLLS